MIVLVVILILLVLFFYFKQRKLVADIKAITEDITTNLYHPDRPIMRMTNEKSIQSLLKVLNPFIDRHREDTKKAMQVDQGMRNTVTNLSHDLKTPLTIILGYTEVLKRDFTSLDQAEMIDNLTKIETHAQKLVQTINDYFDLNKLTAHEMKIESVPLDVSELLKEELLTYYFEIEQADLELELQLLTESAMILGDANSVRRIFSNLLSNALRYGATGNYLAVKSWKSARNLYVEITDHGKGIAEENQQRIFERLATFEDARDKNYTSSGLGLAITKQLVESLNGRIFLYSKPNVRTSFTLEFPLLIMK